VTPRDREIENASQKTSTIILAGGRGTRLMSLTESQAKPAVPFGGSFRIIDFTLSNCVNSGFNRVHVLTQYQAKSLESHLHKGWDAKMGDEGFVNCLNAREDSPYLGTADAVYQNLDVISKDQADWVLILAGDHIYKMDYAEMLAEHIRTGADVTVPCVEVPRQDATGFGVMKVDGYNQIVDFLEKPTNPPGMPGKPDMSLASMGIYIFNAKLLKDELAKDAADTRSEHDFGRNIIPELVKRVKVMAYSFTDKGIGSAYWRDVGTVDAYWEANMDLLKNHPGLNPTDKNWPIFTPEEFMPTVQIAAEDSIVSGGCVINGAYIGKSLLSSRVQVEPNSEIEEAILLPGVTVGRNVRLKRVIVEPDCHIPDGLIVGANPDADAERFHRTNNGVVLINNDMLQSLVS
jgi:glucose-1-phosphate adenylyltransferase